MIDIRAELWLALIVFSSPFYNPQIYLRDIRNTQFSEVDELYNQGLYQQSIGLIEEILSDTDDAKISPQDKFLYASEYMARMGEFKKAHQLLNDGIKHSEIEDESIRNAKLILLKTAVNIGLGFFIEADTLLKEFAELFPGSSRSMRAQHMEYLVLKGYLNLHRGEIFEADYALNEANGFSRKYRGLKSDKSVITEVLTHVTLVPFSDEKDLLSSIETKENTLGELFHLEFLMKECLFHRYKSQFNASYKVFEQRINQYPSGSKWHNQLLLIQALKEVRNSQSRSRVELIDLLDSNTANLDPRARITICYLLYEMASDRDEQEILLKKALEIASESFGQNSNYYHLHRLRLGDHYLNYGYQLDKAKEIYLTSFDQRLRQELGSTHILLEHFLLSLAEAHLLDGDFANAKLAFQEAFDTGVRKFDTEDFAVEQIQSEIRRLSRKYGMTK